MFPFKDGLNTLKLSRFFFEANRDGGSGDSDDKSNGDDNNQNNEAPKTLEAWLDTQPDQVKAQVKSLYEASIATLQSTIKATRQERDEFSKQLKNATKKLQEDSEERKQLEELASKYDRETRRADFMESAINEKCSNPKAAFTIALSEDLFDKSGAPDWKAIKEAAPELFGEKKMLPRKKVAGNGTGNDGQSSSTNMNDWIRRAARGNSVTEQQ